MEITNTIEKLIATVKQDSVALKRDMEEVEKWCKMLAAANLPDLPENHEYAYRQIVANREIVGEELLSRRVYWSDEMDCWAHDNEKKIMDLPKMPVSHVEGGIS